MQERMNGTQQIQVNPIDAARAALAFLQRVQFNASERAAFDAVEAMLNAIAKGEVSLAQGQQPMPPLGEATTPEPPMPMN
jgi:hypothetical protein